jgi:hypothetical protein
MEIVGQPFRVAPVCVRSRTGRPVCVRSRTGRKEILQKNLRQSASKKTIESKLSHYIYKIQNTKSKPNPKSKNKSLILNLSAFTLLDVYYLTGFICGHLRLKLTNHQLTN